MPGTSNFKIFDENGVNIISDADYESSGYRKNGAVSGVAPSNVHNKLYRQTSIMAAALAQAMANRGYAVSDADYNNLVAVLDNIMTEIADNSVTDIKIGNRTVVDNVAPASYTGKLTTLLSGIFYMLRAITGKSDGKTAPAITLEGVSEKFGLSGHKHTGGAGDAPKIASTGLADNAANDTIIGNRTITDTTAAAAGADTVTGLFGKLAYMVKNITGKANWYTVPATTLQALSDLIVSTAAAGKLLKLDSNGKLPTSITGDAATATKLATARTISGVAFDGSINITIPYSGLSGSPAIPADYVVAQSLGVNGWTKWASGKIEQWGRATAATGADVVFPVAFPTAALSIHVTSTRGTSSSTAGQAHLATLTGFKCYYDATDSPGYWFAIGY